MFVRPTLVGGSLRRSNWKVIRESPYFVLQQRGNTSNQQNNNKRRQHYAEYRIITKGFPHYRVSDHDDLNQIQDAFDILHQEVLVGVEGKKTSKKILKQLKAWCESNENSLPFDEDADGYATDTSITPGNSSNEMEDHDNDNYPLISPDVAISSNSSTKSENAVISQSTPISNNSNKGNSSMIGESLEQLDSNNSDDSEDTQSSDASDNEGVTGGGPVNEWISLGSSVLDSLMGWLGGPPLENVPTASSSSSSSKQVNANASSNSKNETILDIPMQFIGLLTYPEIDPRASKKGSFAVLREISFVKQRRRVLFLLTIYMFLVRFCSFDLFLVLLFVSNCAMLFLMKNSGKVNVTMAKRAVRQRIGWAKQWAGSLLFRNKTNNNIVQNNSGPSRKNSNNNSGTPNINVYVNGSTNSVNGIGVSGPVQAANMIKSTSQEILQSGSLSDTTHGGSVLTKVTVPKRVFFRKSSGTTSQTNVKEEKIVSSVMETSSSTGFSSLQKSPSDFPLNSLSSTNGTNTPIQSSNSHTVSGGSVNELSQSASNTSMTQGPTPRRRFFPKRGSGNNNNNNSNNSNSHASNNSNFTLPNIVPTSPLQNTTLPEISNNDSSKTSQTSTSGSSTVTIGNEGSNEESMAHFTKLPNSQQSSSSATDSDLLVNDIYYEGERLKSFLGDLKVK